MNRFEKAIHSYIDAIDVKEHDKQLAKMLTTQPITCFGAELADIFIYAEKEFEDRLYMKLESLKDNDHN